MQNPFGTHFL